MKLRDANLQVYEKKFYISSFMYFYLYFLRTHHHYSSEGALKVRERNFFQEI